MTEMIPLLLQAFDYVDGKLFRKTTGQRAGSKHSNGYRKITIHNKQLWEHRAIFAMFNGFFPEIVDHINGVKDDNRVENLRAATAQTSQYNRGTNKNSTSGIKNVSFIKEKGLWCVALRENKKPKFVGYFKDLELAELVAIEAREKYHAGYTRHV